MNDQITVGAAAIMAGLTITTLGTRWYVKPLGEHRKPRTRAVLDDASLDELLPPWPEPVHGPVVAQEWRDCPRCDNTESCTRNRDGWLCGHCLLPLPTGLSTLAAGDGS